MLFTDIIRKKRDGFSLSGPEIDNFVDGLTQASLPAEQVSALAMAIFLNGLDFGELARLTGGMAKSGVRLNWADQGLDGPIVDKHSTGGVGDKVSFLLAPIVAACGGFVPMIAGRGLGHTGGTVDKIESIPGYQPIVDFDKFRAVVKAVGCAVIGQTVELAPADRRFYAIRDVTGTVESIPLITASILSKKLAAGLSGLVMDIKVGSGAFMETDAAARELSDSIIATGERNGLKIRSVLTDMNSVLGRTAGNALELVESIEFLRNDGRERRLNEVTLRLCAELLVLGGIESNIDLAIERADAAVNSGDAAERFNRMVHALGGPKDIVNTFEDDLPVAAVRIDVFPECAGYVSEIDTRSIGNAIILLGGGRRRLDDNLDLSVGLAKCKSVGEYVDHHEPICEIHASSRPNANEAAKIIVNAVKVGALKVEADATIK